MTDGILSLLPPEIKLVNTRHGLMVFPAGDFYIGRCLETYGEYCPEEGNAFRQLLKPGDVVVEAGANVGSHTILLSNLVGPDGFVHAFEPQRLIFQMLCANLALNGIQNAQARQQGAGRSRNVLRMSPPPAGAVANFGGVRLAVDGEEAVDVVPLDCLDLQRLDLLKIDVEGMEEAVICGGIETIRRLRPKLYLENDAGGSRPEASASLIRLIRDLGYSGGMSHRFACRKTSAVTGRTFSRPMSFRSTCSAFATTNM